MTMDELRRQLATTRWPITMRVDGKEITVNAPEDLMIPRAGNLVCAYEEGAFEVIDCSHISTLSRSTNREKQPA